MKNSTIYLILTVLFIISCEKEPLKTFTGHESYVNTIDVSTDNKYLASGSSDKTIKIWDIETGENKKTLQGHKKRINFVKFFENGNKIISTAGDSRIYTWDVKTGKKDLSFISKFGQFEDLKIAANNRFVATTEYNVKTQKHDLLILGTKNLDLQKRIKNTGQHIVISPDNEYVFYSKQTENQIMAYAINQDSSFVFAENKSTVPVCISGDKKYIAFHPNHFDSYFVEIYDFMDAKKVSRIELDHISLPQYRNTQFTTDNSGIAVIIDNKVCIYDIKTGKLQKEVQSHKCQMQLKDFSFLSNNRVIMAYEAETTNLLMLNY